LGLLGGELEAILPEVVPTADDVMIQDLTFFERGSFVRTDRRPDRDTLIGIFSYQKIERPYRDLIQIGRLERRKRDPVSAGEFGEDNV